jgi:hypothetical protein
VRMRVIMHVRFTGFARRAGRGDRDAKVAIRRALNKFGIHAAGEILVAARVRTTPATGPSSSTQKRWSIASKRRAVRRLCHDLRAASHGSAAGFMAGSQLRGVEWQRVDHGRSRPSHPLLPVA